MVYKITYHNGKQVEKTFVEEVVSAKPINKIIKKGTKVEEVKVASSRGESSRKISSNANSKGKYMSVVATAYTGDSITSTGKKPKWGTIAVDPTVIPYGTKVYIPQFNKTFIAEDCGGAIKGNKIDIFMNDESSVYNWGRKVIPYGTKVYIPQFNKTFIAEDCGGAIKGNKIDIFMNDESSVYNWGRKTIDIYIVN